MKTGSVRHLRHLKKISRLGGIAKGKINKSPLQRFHENYQIDANGCWIWTKNLSRGYGSFKVNGVTVKASRWAYEYFKETKIPSRKIFVCHTCDVRSCVNPDHLFLGSTQDNMDDCASKNRFVKGSKHPSSVLTEQEVIEIRALRKTIGPVELSRRFKVSRERIYRICKNEEWKHV